MVEFLQKNKRASETFSFCDLPSRKGWEPLQAIFSDIIKEDTSLFLCCSGGPDSMFMTHCILFFRYFTLGQDVSRITILHFNHNDSQEDLFTEKFLYTYFTNFTISSTKCFLLKPTETVLRKARRNFFYNSLQKYYNPLQSVVLCLGHHLDDRIENTYLHLDRGTHLQGIINMRLSEKNYYFSPGKLSLHTIFRPLIGFKKKEILALCKKFNIPYINDPHNITIKKSPRNNLRKKLLKLTRENPLIYTHMKTIYSSLENNFFSHPYPLTEIKFSQYWGSHRALSFLLPIGVDETASLLRSLRLYGGISTARLQQLSDRFRYSKGYIKINNIWIFICHRKGYAIENGDKRPFRINRIDQKVHIDKPGNYTLGDFIRPISEEYVGGILKFANTHQTYKGKKRMNRCTNQKIPLFRRRYLPIIEKNNIIIAVLPTIYRGW